MKIILFDGGKLPEYSNPDDAGMDVFAREETEWFIKDGLWRCNVPLGFAIKCPREYGIFIFSRSGMGRNESISLVNSVGIGDRSFGENEYGAMLTRPFIACTKPVNIQKHQKIAQIVLLHTPKIILDVVDSFNLDNQKDGFGSSGSY